MNEVALARPEAAGIREDKLDEIRSLMNGYIADGKVASVVTVLARGGKTAMMDAFGVLDLETGVPTEADSIFRIYSMTKPITGVAMMCLFEEGKFALDDPVGKYLPALEGMEVFAGTDDAGKIVTEPAHEPMTIRHLMTHTAGISYGWHPDDAVDEMYRETGVNARNIDIAEMVERMGRTPLLYQPGTRWQYSLAVDVQGRLIEVLSGMSFDEFLKQRIFTPLGMEDTGFHVPEEKRPRFTSNYGPAGMTTPTIIADPDKVDAGGAISRIDKAGASSYDISPMFLSGGGGLVSTAPDYLKFAGMLLGRGEARGVRILEPGTVELMTQNHIADDLVPISLEGLRVRGTGFGLGVSVRVDASDQRLPGSQGEFGWGGAASTDVFISPHDALIGIMLTQFMPKFHYPIEAEFKKLAYEALIR